MYDKEMLALFREMITTARRRTGHLQKELATALGLDAHVLSRKLHGTRTSFLTHAEVKQIIRTLAVWDAIATQAEANRLLELMGLNAEIFSEVEWMSGPLKRLERASSLNILPSLSEKSEVFPTHASLPIPMNTLIGRESSIQLVLDRLRNASVRLLTLIGPGGVGKTRLALEVAHIIQHDFPDGVFFLSVASLFDAALLPATLVQALHLVNQSSEKQPDRHRVFSHEEVLRYFLREKQVLLIFDNVEHLPEISLFINDLLESAKALKIMVTSRAVLHLYGESIFDVPSLPICPSDHIFSLKTFERCAAMNLFLERAQSLNPAFCLTQENVGTVAAICSHVDGLPLAIELAAARSKVFPLSTILSLVMNGMSTTMLHTTAQNVLPRHQTLQATLDWSYQLLDSQAQAHFRRYSVFVGGWTLEAAQEIMAVNGYEETADGVIEQIENLIDQSLVKRAHGEEHPESRFQFLETIREYALRQLEASGERAEVQQRHAHYYLTLVSEVDADEKATEQPVSIVSFVEEQGNLRAALAWATEHGETEIVLRMSSALGRFWDGRMQFCEAHRWIDAMFKTKVDTSISVKAKLLMGAARLTFWEIGYERSRELAQEALKLYAAADDQVGRTWALFQIGETWQLQGEYEQASAYLEECLQLLQEQKDWKNYTFTLSRLGALATLQGNVQQARVWLDEAVFRLRADPKPGLLAVTLIYQGILSSIQNDWEQSCAYLRESLLLAQRVGNLYMVATNMLVFGCVVGSRQGPSYTACLCSAAEMLYARMDITVPVLYRPLYDMTLGKMRAQVDKTTWETWWAKGQAISVEDMCTLAISASQLEE